MRAILVIVLILLIVFNSGCAELQNEKLDLEDISNASSDIIGKFSKPAPSYEFQVTEVRYLEECIENAVDQKEGCLLVNLEIRNNHSESVDFEIMEKTIVTKDGKQIERYGGFFDTKQLSGQCDTSSYYELFPNAHLNSGICFPTVSKSDNPMIYLKARVNGNPKEHSFDLTPYFS